MWWIVKKSKYISRKCLSNNEVKYNIINYLKDIDEDNLFCQKIIVIFDDKKKRKSNLLSTGNLSLFIGQI